MALKLITPPEAEPVTLLEAKSHLRVNTSDEDNLITNLIIVAREYCESYQNKVYITQTWELWIDRWPGGDKIEIPLPPLQSIESIKYYDTADTEYTFAATEYLVDVVSFIGRVILKYGKTWPTITLRPDIAICVKFKAGYGDITKVPQKVKQAMLLLIGHWYENREAVITGSASKEIAFAVNALLNLDRVVPI